MSWGPYTDPKLTDRATAEAIELLVVPRAVDLGEIEARRALPSTKRQMVGPWPNLVSVHKARVCGRTLI